MNYVFAHCFFRREKILFRSSYISILNRQYLGYLTPYVFELLNPVREGNNLGWADKSEVKRVEVDNNILPSIVRERNLLNEGV